MVISQNAVSTFNIGCSRALLGLEPLSLRRGDTGHQVCLSQSRETESVLCLHSFHLTPFENVLWQKLKKTMRPYYPHSPSEVACQ